jgi:hypothetical protein
MRFLSFTLAAVFAVAVGTPRQRNQTLDLKPVLKEQNGLAYVDQDTRTGYIARAALWHPVDLDEIDARAGRQILDSTGSSKTLPNDSTVECRYLQEPVGGTTEKFHCQFVQATDSNNKPIKIQLKKLKVRYNSFKTVSDVIVSRLTWMLGFGSDIQTPVVKVICDGCSRDPFHQKAPVHGQQIFTRASIETALPGGEGIYVEGTRYPKDEGKDESAWYWDELKYITNPERKVESDALKLYAVFLKHGDSKAIQNNLICLTPLDKGICNDPFLYVKDFGSTLGSDGLSVHPMDLKKWSTDPVWVDNQRCIGSLRVNFGNGPGLSDPEISEAGRKFLANLLSNLIKHESKLRDIFDAAHIQEFDDHGHKYSADDWVVAFEARAELIINRPPCPN